MQKRQRRWRTIIASGVAMGAGALFIANGSPATQNVKAAQEPNAVVGVQTMAGMQAVVTPTHETVQTSDQPFALSAAQQAAAQAHMDKVAGWMAARASSLPRSSAGNVVVPLALETQTQAPAEASPAPQAPGTLQFHHTSIISNANSAPPGFGVASVAEPAVAYNGKNVWMTWNWGAAKSTTSGFPTATGNGWTFMNPTTGPSFPDFCCDQDMIYDKGRDIFIWERMGINPRPSASTNENRVLFSVSRGGGAVNCTYQIQPSMWGRSNELFDYPRMALSTDWMYVTFNGFSTTSGAFLEHWFIKFPLDSMRSCASASLVAWTLTQGWSPAAVENATDTMYFGDQVATTPTTNQFIVYWNPENSNTLSWVTRTIAAFTFTSGNAVCPVAGGANPCGRGDMRVLGGVISSGGPAGPANHQIDFFWNVAQGGSFPLPYTESAGFDVATLTYNARKLLWNGSFALWYANAAANDRGDTGVSMQVFNSGINPTEWVGIDDNFNGTPPGWEVIQGVSSTGAWTANNSGDYTRVRSYAPAGVGFVTSGWYRDGSLNAYIPFFSAWNRGRDEPGMTRFDKK